VASSEHEVIIHDAFCMQSVAISSKPLEIRTRLWYKLTTHIFSMDSSLCQCAVCMNDSRVFFRNDTSNNCLPLHTLAPLLSKYSEKPNVTHKNIDEKAKFLMVTQR